MWVVHSPNATLVFKHEKGNLRPFFSRSWSSWDCTRDYGESLHLHIDQRRHARGGNRSLQLEVDSRNPDARIVVWKKLWTRRMHALHNSDRGVVSRNNECIFFLCSAMTYDCKNTNSNRCVSISNLTYIFSTQHRVQFLFFRFRSQHSKNQHTCGEHRK